MSGIFSFCMNTKIYHILQTIPEHKAKTDNTNKNNDNVDDSDDHPLRYEF